MKYDPANFSRQPATHIRHGQPADIETTAHYFLADILDGIGDPEEEGGVYDSQRMTARTYMVAGGGPSAWFYVISKDGEIDEVFFLYSEFASGAAVRVPSAYHADLVAQLESDRRLIER